MSCYKFRKSLDLGGECGYLLFLSEFPFDEAVFFESLVVTLCLFNGVCGGLLHRAVLVQHYAYDPTSCYVGGDDLTLLVYHCPKL